MKGESPDSLLFGILLGFSLLKIMKIWRLSSR